MVRKAWSRVLSFDWKLGAGLILVFGLARFVLVMNAAGAVLSHAGFNIAMTYFNFYG